MYKINKRSLLPASKGINKKSGFTLIELLTVLLIISILVSIAVPLYSQIDNIVKRRACQANLRTLDGAALQYSIANDSYPPILEALIDPAYLLVLPTCQSGGIYTYNNNTGKTACNIAGHSYPD